MGMPRERKVLVGLGAVAVTGLMVDQLFLQPENAAASPQPAPAETASAGGPVQAVANAVGGRVEAGIREVMTRALGDFAAEGTPEIAFGPDLAWTERLRAAVQEPQAAANENARPAQTVQTGILPGLTATPRLTLVMPTRDGGIAVIDGHRMRVGEVHPDGYRLEGVGVRSVSISMGGSTAMLSLPSPGN